MSNFIFGQSPDYWEKVGDEEKSMQNWSSAFEAYKMSFDLDSSEFERRYKLAESAFQVREDLLANRLFLSLVKMDQGKIHPESYLYLGKLHQRNARYDEVGFCIKKYKQKSKAKRNNSVETFEADLLLSSSQWAINQVKEDSVQFTKMAINTLESESQPYWENDSIRFLKWSNDSAMHSEWKMASVDSSGKNVHFSKAFWNNYPVMHIVNYTNGKWGVGRDVTGQLVLLHQSKSEKHWSLLSAINDEHCQSSMPEIGVWDGVEYLVFSSNRNGGIGGWDLWISRFTDGKWSVPFNAGKLNTVLDEIEPRVVNCNLYFSSNGHIGFGEFDVFKVNGKPGIWGEITNQGMPVNSSKNDIGFDIWRNAKGTESIWLLGSTRDSNGCCSDVFTYKWNKKEVPEIVKDTIPFELKKIQNWLPLKLYFHNDEPNPNSWDTLTALNFTQCQISYLDKEVLYQEQLKGDDLALEEWEKFKDNNLVNTYNRLQTILLIIEKRLTLGDTITLVVRGFASPLADGKYNKNLTSRRIESLRNEIKKFHNGALAPFFDSSLFIKAIPYGESNSKKVSDDKKNQKQSVFSSSARLERRIEIEAIDWRTH